MFKRIVDYISFTLTPLVAGILIVLAGFIIVLGGARPEMINQGKKMLTNTLIGVIIIYGSFMITNAIIKTIAPGDLAESWFKLDCQVPVPATPARDEALCGDNQKLAERYRTKYPRGNAPELDTLIQCIRGKLPAGTNLGSVFTYDSIEACNYTRGVEVCASMGSCNHTTRSCHYGGNSGNQGALAVDFGNEAVGDQIIAAAIACGVPQIKARCENGQGQKVACNAGANHVHISAASCDNN